MTNTLRIARELWIILFFTRRSWPNNKVLIVVVVVVVVVVAVVVEELIHTLPVLTPLPQPLLHPCPITLIPMPVTATCRIGSTNQRDLILFVSNVAENIILVEIVN